MPTVHIPALLRGTCGGLATLSVDGSTLDAVLRALDNRCPGLYRLVVENGALKPELAIAIDGEVAAYALDEPVRPDAEIAIVPAIAGG